MIVFGEGLIHYNTHNRTCNTSYTKYGSYEKGESYDKYLNEVLKAIECGLRAIL